MTRALVPTYRGAVARGVPTWVINGERDASVGAGVGAVAGHCDGRVLNRVACVKDAKGGLAAARSDQGQAGIGLRVLKPDRAAVMLDSGDEVDAVGLRVEVKAVDVTVPWTVEGDRGAEHRRLAVGAAHDDLPVVTEPANQNASSAPPTREVEPGTMRPAPAGAPVAGSIAWTKMPLGPCTLVHHATSAELPLTATAWPVPRPYPR
jgi:hypothetical protein